MLDSFFNGMTILYGLVIFVEYADLFQAAALIVANRTETDVETSVIERGCGGNMAVKILDLEALHLFGVAIVVAFHDKKSRMVCWCDCIIKYYVVLINKKPPFGGFLSRYNVKYP